jgi:hypothetical protein
MSSALSSNIAVLIERRAEVAIDRARLALAGASLSLEEILSLWPDGHHHRLELWAKLGAGGEISVGARPRGHELDPSLRRPTTEPWRARDRVPVVLELDDGCEVVVSLRALREGDDVR